jgi:hypothetical protein
MAEGDNVIGLEATAKPAFCDPSRFDGLAKDAKAAQRSATL